MTLTRQDVRKLRAEFKAAHIKAEIVDPDEDSDLLISILTTGRVQIEPGKVDIRVFIDPDERQLVMWADEAVREMQRVAHRPFNHSLKFTKKAREEIERDFRAGGGFPISLPTGTTYEIVGDIWRGDGGHDAFARNQDQDYVYANIKARVPATEQTFLIGTDEHSQFVCGLPQRVKTVKRAHAVLRPPGVPKNAPRQGEWFFVPATQAEKRQIEAFIATGAQLELKSTWLGAALDTGQQCGRDWYHDDAYHDADDDTSHVALTAIKVETSKKPPQWTLFVRGYIIDDRSPEESTPRHDPMWLDEWHRPVRNLEVQFDSQDSETWD